MTITKKLCYGVSEDTPKELLYVKKIILRSYDDENKNKTFMEIMGNFKIYNFNYDKAKDSDYFMWQYVNDNDIRDWKHIDLCCYQKKIWKVCIKCGIYLKYVKRLMLILMLKYNLMTLEI